MTPSDPRTTDPSPGSTHRGTAPGHRGGGGHDVTRTDPSALARPSLSSLAGPMLLGAGLLIAGSQLVLWPLRSQPITAVLTGPTYAIAMTAYVIGYWVLIIGVFALHHRQARAAGRFGLVALVAAAAGTANMAGNAWFDTFVAPWLAHQIPAALEVPRDGTLVTGALSSYVMMALGWVLLGVACFRARVIPRALALALIPAGLLAYVPLPPYSVIFGATVVGLGLWLTRHPARTTAGFGG